MFWCGVNHHSTDLPNNVGIREREPLDRDLGTLAASQLRPRMWKLSCSLKCFADHPFLVTLKFAKQFREDTRLLFEALCIRSKIIVSSQRKKQDNGLVRIGK